MSTSTTTSKPTADQSVAPPVADGAGRRLAERLGLTIVGTEGHDLKTPCVSCQSSDAGRVHQDTGVYFCFSCNKALNAFDLCKLKLGDHKAAIDAMVAVGLFEDRPHSGNGQPRYSGNGKASSGTTTLTDSQVVGAVAKAKGCTAAGLQQYGATVRGNRVVFPMFDGQGKACSTFTLTLHKDGTVDKGLNAKGKPAGMFLPCSVIVNGNKAEAEPRLPQKGEMWLTAEGVKDPSVLADLGYLAVGLPGNSLKAEYAPLLQGADVAIVRHADFGGIAGAEKTAAVLHGIAALVRVVTLPVETKESGGADVRDVLREQGPDAVHKCIDEATPVGADGKPPAAPPRFLSTLLTSQQLDELDREPKYLVKNAVPAGQPGAAGAKQKGCKTSVITDLVISAASATPFLGEFDVPEPVNVLYLCGESGMAKTRRLARQVCQNRGLALRDLPIWWGFDLPKLCLQPHVDALAEFITRKKIGLVPIDPLYLALFTAETAGHSGDLFTMGAVYEPLTKVCRETGAAILLVHHFRKNRSDDQQEPCSLEELTQAGLGEFARWWILLDRREPYVGDGRHALWLRVGGSEGHASFWGLDIDEGLTVDSEGNQRTTKWDVSLSRVQDAKAEQKRQRENRKAAEQEQREGEHRERLLVVLRKVPDGDTAKGLREASGLNTANFGKAIACLVQEGRAKRVEIVKRGTSYDAYQPTGK